MQDGHLLNHLLSTLKETHIRHSQERNVESHIQRIFFAENSACDGGSCGTASWRAW